MKPEILILAAGSSSRMRGGDKLLERIDGIAQITRIAAAALATEAPVTVALPPDRPGRAAAVQGLALRLITVPNPGDGMAASLVAGLAALPPGAPVLLLLADLPEITGDDLTAFLAAWTAVPDQILRGTAQDGTPGHPVGFPSWAVPGLAALTGDSGARQMLQQHKDRTRFYALPDRHATTDLDTPEDWQQWRALHGK